MVKVKEDLTGRVFGMLTVMRQAEDRVLSRGERVPMWVCQCCCADRNIVVVMGNNLKRKNGTRSCGCIHSEVTRKLKHKTNRYDLTGEYGIGWTSNTNREFYFDLSDYDIIKDICWLEYFYKGVSRICGYNPKTKRVVRMHSFLGYKNHDHIDKNELNNRRENLRPCTHQQNDFNRGLYKNNKSGITGVSWKNKERVWTAAICHNGKSIYLGCFKNKDDAIVARLRAEAEHFGDFAPQKHLFEKYGININNNTGEL